MRERRERLGLERQVAPRVLVAGHVRAQHLGHEQREALVVPDERDLVAAAAAEALEDRPARGDLVALGPVPARVAAHAPASWQAAGRDERPMRAPRAASMAADARRRLHDRRQAAARPRARHRASFARHNPGIPFFTGLADRVDGAFDPAAEPFTTIELAELGLPAEAAMPFRLADDELAYATTPFLIEHLLDRGYDRVLFFKRESLVTGEPRAEPRAARRRGDRPHPAPARRRSRARRASASSTCSWRAPTTSASSGSPSRRPRGRCCAGGRSGCASTAATTSCDGLHFEQRWVDLVPGMFDGVRVTRDPGASIGHWSLPERRVEVDGEDVRVDGRPCRLVRFSGYDLDHPEAATRYDDRLALADAGGDAAALFRRYRELVLAAGHAEARALPYAFAAFDNGVPVPAVARALHARLGPRAAAFGDPFATAGPGSFWAWLTGADEELGGVTRLWASVVRARPDVHAAYAARTGSTSAGSAAGRTTPAAPSTRSRTASPSRRHERAASSPRSSRRAARAAPACSRRAWPATIPACRSSARWSARRRPAASPSRRSPPAGSARSCTTTSWPSAARSSRCCSCTCSTAATRACSTSTPTSSCSRRSPTCSSASSATRWSSARTSCAPTTPRRELYVLESGAYNGGLVGVSDRPETRRFLAAWADRVRRHPELAPGRGLNYDQRWLDLAPGHVEDLHVLRAPDVNVGHWRLPVTERPRLMHFSAFDPDRPGPREPPQRRAAGRARAAPRRLRARPARGGLGADARAALALNPPFHPDGQLRAARAVGESRSCARPTSLLLAAVLLLWAASAAEAAPPPNDARSAAQRLTIPANVQGTTVEATLDEDEPPGCVAGAGHRLVRRSASTGRGRSSSRSTPRGDMDATRRGVLPDPLPAPVAGLLQTTNNRGEATLDLDAAARHAVPDPGGAARELGPATRFRLRVVAPDEPARAPGERLPGDGTSGELDRFANGDDAWAVQHDAKGRTYRINLVTRGGGCVRGELYAPGNFRAAAEESLDCDDHVVYTPRRSGTYTVLLRAPRGSRDAAHLPAPRRPRGARRLRAGHPARRRPARARHARRQRARRARHLSLHDRAPRRPAAAARDPRRLRPCA